MIPEEATAKQIKAWLDATSSKRLVDMDEIEHVCIELGQAMAVLWMGLEKLGTLDTMRNMTHEELTNIQTGFETVYYQLSGVSKRLHDIGMKALMERIDEACSKEIQ